MVFLKAWAQKGSVCHAVMLVAIPSNKDAVRSFVLYPSTNYNCELGTVPIPGTRCQVFPNCNMCAVDAGSTAIQVPVAAQLRALIIRDARRRPFSGVMRHYTVRYGAHGWDYE